MRAFIDGRKDGRISADQGTTTTIDDEASKRASERPRRTEQARRGGRATIWNKLPPSLPRFSPFSHFQLSSLCRRRSWTIIGYASGRMAARARPSGRGR